MNYLQVFLIVAPLWAIAFKLDDIYNELKKK